MRYLETHSFLEMVDSVLVSDEIESVIDKENLFGFDSSEKIPVHAHFESGKILGDLYHFSEEGGSTTLKFKIKPSPLIILILKRIAEKIVIGSEEWECIIFEKPEIISASITVEEDMYICQIIMNNKE